MITRNVLKGVAPSLKLTKAVYAGIPLCQRRITAPPEKGLYPIMIKFDLDMFIVKFSDYFILLLLFFNYYRYYLLYIYVYEYVCISHCLIVCMYVSM